jgi:hypothetical protein
VLTLDEQRSVVQWAWKTVLLMEVVRTREVLVPTAEYRRFFTSRTPQVGGHCWMTAWEPRQRPSVVNYWCNSLEFHPSDPVLSRHGFRATLSVGRAVFQLLAPEYPATNYWVGDGGAPPAVYPIWPPRTENDPRDRFGIAVPRDIALPLSPIMEEEGLDRFANRPVGDCALFGPSE